MADDRNARTERQRRNSRVATVDADDRSGQCAPALAFRVGASPFLGPRALMTVAHQAMANAIRALAMDAVQAANSGHPGMPMGMADVAKAIKAEWRGVGKECVRTCRSRV